MKSIVPIPQNMNQPRLVRDWLSKNRITLTYQTSKDIKFRHITNPETHFGQTFHDLPSLVKLSDALTNGWKVTPIGIDVHMENGVSFSIPPQLIIGARLRSYTDNVLLLSKFEEAGFPKDFKTDEVDGVNFVKVVNDFDVRLFSNVSNGDTEFDKDKAIMDAFTYILESSFKGPFSIRDADDNIIVSEDDLNFYRNEYVRGNYLNTELYNSFRYHFTGSRDFEDNYWMSDKAGVGDRRSISDKFMTDKTAVGSLLKDFNGKSYMAEVDVETYTERSTIAKIFGRDYDVSHNTKLLRIVHIGDSLPADKAYPGMESFSYYNVRYGLQDIMSLKVVDGFYDDSLKFVKDKNADLLINRSYLTVDEFKEYMVVLATASLNNYPEKLTVNSDMFEHESVMSALGIDLTLPTTFEPFDLVGDEALDKIIKQINKFRVTTTNDADKALVEIEREHINNVIDGARTIVNSDNITDRDEKLSRVGLVLNNYLNSLTKEHTESKEDLNDFEVSLRLLEAGESLKL